jgi:hypothetical protein
MFTRYKPRYGKRRVSDKKIALIYLVHTILVLLPALLTFTTAAIVQPVKSDNFVERIGLVTHLGNPNLPYVNNYAGVKVRLGELGIRYIRRGADGSPYDRVDLFNDHGIRFNFLSSTWTTTLSDLQISSFLTKVRPFPTASILSIEGANEYDNSNFNNQNPDWALDQRENTRALWDSVKNDPVLKGITVAGPAINRGYYREAGDLSAFVDKGSIHWYPGIREPSHNEFSYFAWFKNEALKYQYPGKRLWLTETGYYTSKSGVSERVSARYLPRSLFWFLYTHDIERVFIYQLCDYYPDPDSADREKFFGLLRHDLTPKLSYTALKNLIALFSDTDTNFTPSPFSYQLTGDTAKVKNLLFQKKDGTLLLALWQEVRSWNVDSLKPIQVVDRQLNVELASEIDTVYILHPCDPERPPLTPVKEVKRTRSFSVAVPDHVIIVVLKNTAGTTAVGRAQTSGNRQSFRRPVLYLSFPAVVPFENRNSYDLQGRSLRKSCMPLGESLRVLVTDQAGTQ